MIKKNPKIYLIGTAHQETEFYKVDDLVEKIKEIKPGLILMEYDSSFFDEDFELKREFEGIEDLAVKIYRSNRKIPIRPYDIEGRNRFYQESRYFEKIEAMINDFQDLKNNDGFSEEAIFALNMLDEISAAKNFWLQNSPNVQNFNSSLGDQIVKTEHNMRYATYRRVIEITPKLHIHKDTINLIIDEWERRNREMADNIIRWSYEFDGYKIAVLMGAEHRYKIKELFQMQNIFVREIC